MKSTASEGNASNNLNPRRVFLTDCATLVSGIEDDLRTVMAHTPFLLTRCSADLRYQFVNDAYARMLGLRATQIIGKPIGEIIGDNALKTILPHVRGALQGNRVEYESEIGYKSVGARSVRAIYTPERDSRGSVKGWVASIIDLTNHKVADTRLTAYRFSRFDGDCHDSAEHDAALPPPDCTEMVVSNPTVEIFPADVVRRRAIASHTMTAESVQTASRGKVEYRFRAPVHLLVIYENGSRRSGETFVEGLPQAGPGTFAHKFTFVPAGREYYERYELSTPSRLMFLYLDPKKFRFLSEAHFADILPTPRLFFEDESLWHTIMELENLIDHPELRDPRYFDALGVVIAYRLRLHRSEVSGRSPIQGGLATWQQRIAAAYIDQHLSERIRLDTLAHLARQSPFHFCREFKKSFGVAPLRYQTRRRIEYAKLLLTEPEMSVTDVGLTIGFSSLSSFDTAFRKATGFTPTRYKRSLG